MSKEKSLIIRGIAILLMLAYHLHDISDSYTSLVIIGGKPLTYFINNMANPVCFFILLSGYGLSFKAHTYRMSEKLLKVLKLYITFWVVMVIFPIGLGSILSPEQYPGSVWDVVSNATGFRWTYNTHNWFLLPYAILYLLSDYIIDFVEKHGDKMAIVLSLIIYFASSYIVSRYRSGFFRIHGVYLVLLTVKLLFPFVAGIVMERLHRKDSLIWKKLASPMALFLLLIACVARGLVHTHMLNPFFAIVVVWLLLHIDFMNGVNKVLTALGNMSMPMWFVHGYFTLYLFHDYLCMLKYPLLIYVILVIISYLLSILIIKMSNFLYFRINKNLIV